VLPAVSDRTMYVASLFVDDFAAASRCVDDRKVR
jgi:hypothetical protein